MRRLILKSTALTISSVVSYSIRTSTSAIGLLIDHGGVSQDSAYHHPPCELFSVHALRTLYATELRNSSDLLTVSFRSSSFSFSLPSTAVISLNLCFRFKIFLFLFWSRWQVSFCEKFVHRCNKHFRCMFGVKDVHDNILSLSDKLEIRRETKKHSISTM